MYITTLAIESFRTHIWEFYHHNKRTFAWRNVDDPYRVVVSEIMLQQTQTYRVVPKYEQFITEFPNFEYLAQASLRDVLSIWQGLGYNRRGRALHTIASKVVNEYEGKLPNSPEILTTFQGIGPASAGSICAFAFNSPTVFIETNIRTVFIHSFFNNQLGIHDKQLFPLVAATLDHAAPREWYYALMDYGVYVKKMYVNPNRQSTHYTKQSRFIGSDRQIRGLIIRLLTHHQQMEKRALIAATHKESARVEKIIDQLCVEGFIKQTDGYCAIA